MLTSKKLELRRSEIRQSLAELANIETPSEDEVRKMGQLDSEYRAKESQFRAALVAEDEERKEAGAELETRSEAEWANMASQFEVRQVALALDEGRKLDGATAEMVQELRNAGGFQGIPVPLEALETRAGETIAGGVPDPMRTMPTIDRIFAGSSATQMGCRMINVGVGEIEYPVATGGAQPGWAGSETGDVAGPQAYTTVDRPMKPDNTLGVQMKITRKALKQAGAGLEQAVRRDMSAAIQQETDRAIFLGSGSSGEPLGIFPGASTYGITETAVDAAASYAAFRAAAVRFMTANTASGPSAVNLLLRPEVFDGMDDLISGLAISEWDRLIAKIGKVVMTTNGIAAPSGDPLESKALLTTTTNGVAPIFCGMWGAVDVIRDPFSDAKSGQLRLTALTTLDVTVARGVQLEILTGVQ
ncbi:phage major capsid protein [Thalassovita taeanensis]|uniref:Phage major capsid protein, HK97 family n=1 Tax=Thalassovita taeanensis TaxID=657014 RepID=A0A1H8ZBY9_9RHOB|nr:phage major capsid protein [Thalassovita taeanensis]SEP61932.1 phage major capsid protein, HK97 family [Thalassovita taeanensis]